jgi:aspartate aminotransferase, mitochondrial
VSLGIGAYRDDSGKPYVLPSVRKAEERLLAKKLNHEYAGIDGVQEFLKASLEFCYGSEAQGSASAALAEGRIGGVQSISGTGALRLGGEFLARFRGKGSAIYLPNPTWANHNAIFKDSGLEVRQYAYYDPKTCGLDFLGMCGDLQAAPEGSTFLLHACAHNPTGVDPTPDQWGELSEVIKAKGHVVFFDNAYQVSYGSERWVVT